MRSDLVADLHLYRTEDGGRHTAIRTGFKCPCMDRRGSRHGWDCRIDVGPTPLKPGERRRVLFSFLSGPAAADALRQARKFYLWEGRFIGEAIVATGGPRA